MQLLFSYLKCSFLVSLLVFSSSSMTRCEHLNQLINHLAHWIIIYRWIAIWWSCLCLPVCLVAVCFCDLSFPVTRHWRWNLYLKAYLSFEADIVLRCVDVKCTFQYIRSWQWWRRLSISRCVCFCASKRKRVRQWEEMASVIGFACSSLSSAARRVIG